jgi:guanine deaminase
MMNAEPPPNLRALMDRAITLAEEGMQGGAGGPFGALVARDGETLAEGCNEVTSSNDPTAHAEIVAIRRATAKLRHFELRGCILVTSCEPCPMCLAAAYWSRVDHIYYANTRAQAAAIGFDDRMIYDEIARPVAARQIAMTRLPGPRDEVAFTRWQQDPSKIRY